MAKNEEDIPLTLEPPREGYEQYMLRRMREEGRKDRLRKATRMAWLTFEHNFSKFRVSIEILNEPEPIQFKDDMTQWLQKDLELNDKTCDEISNKLYLKITEKYPGRTVWIDVSKDGENGVLTQYNKRV